MREIEFLRALRDRADFDAFKDNASDVRAASYSVLVISEAVRRIPEAWLAEYPHMPWHAIKSIGNKLRHEYQRVSEVILWGIITEHTDGLKTVLDDMLARHGAGENSPGSG